jgi:hypothetical protein
MTPHSGGVTTRSTTTPDDPEFYERQQKFDDAELELLVLMRQALSIPEGDPSLPPPGYRYEPRPTDEEVVDEESEET